MDITWQANDGYVGGARPHHTSVTDDEIQQCGSLEEAMGLVESAIQEDFNTNVSCGYDYKKVEAEVKNIWDARPPESLN